MTKTGIVKLYFLIFLLELFLEAFDICLESFLTLFMLKLQGQDLVVSFRSLTGVVKAFLVRNPHIFSQTFDSAFHFCDGIFSKHDIEPHDIDLFAALLVFSFDVIQEDFFVLKLMLQ